MKESIQELDVVALTKDHPERQLVAGQVGTVVAILDRNTFEVEFVDDCGRTYAMAPLKADELMVLLYAPAVAV